MIDVQLPAGPDGQRILWSPWTGLAECGRDLGPRDCRRCGLNTPHDRSRGHLAGDETVRAMAFRCSLCGGVRAVWYELTPGRTVGSIRPLCSGRHVHQIVNDQPREYGPCLDCGQPYQESQHG